MTQVVIDISMSLDGFIAGPHDEIDPLHDWVFTGRAGDMSALTEEGTALLRDAPRTVGAVIAGRRTYDLAEGWGGNPPLPGQYFVLSHHAPPEAARPGSRFSFVEGEIAGVVAQARTAAGERDVVVMGGASAASQAIKAGLVDELRIHLAPVLLGRGIRLFGDIGAEPIRLVRKSATASPRTIHLVFRVIHGNDAAEEPELELTRVANMRLGQVIVGTTMSLDGYINDRQGNLDGLGSDLDVLRKTEMLKEEIRTTGAVVMGRRAFDLAQGDLTGYAFQVPIFVLTHHAPEKEVRGQNEHLRVYYVADGIESAVAKAKAAAGGKNVIVIGSADTAQQCIAHGLADEIAVSIMPVLLGSGLRFFQETDRQIRLEKSSLIISPAGRTDIFYRVAGKGPS
ncbi:MAG: dihydrofolate reductase family protein [Rudaea sp.]